jgi:hypothetical protein
MNEKPNSTAPCSPECDLLQLNIHYRDPPVSSRTTRAGDDLTIIAGQGYSIDKVTLFPALRTIKGVRMSHGENAVREETRTA